ncbi:uncharacterized protein LOC144579880 [Callithrix jacchus]
MVFDPVELKVHFFSPDLMMDAAYILAEDLKNGVHRRNYSKPKVTHLQKGMLASLVLGWHLRTWLLERSLHLLIDKEDSLYLACTSNAIYSEQLLYSGTLEFWKSKMLSYYKTVDSLGYGETLTDPCILDAGIMHITKIVINLELKVII